MVLLSWFYSAECNIGKNMTFSAKSSASNVLVIGAGVAGAAIAQRLGRAGVAVYLIEKEATIGGHVVAMGCKATNVCLKCNVCVAHDTLKSVLNAQNVNICTRTELTCLQAGVNGSRYTAVLTHKPSIVDSKACIGCGICIDLSPEKAIGVACPAISLAATVVDEPSWLRASESARRQCAEACPVGAIHLNPKETTRKIDVDAVVLAIGYQQYDPAENSSYSYGGLSNVITGIEAETQLARQNQITRPSDKGTPKRIAFIQCVGSRTEEVYRSPTDTDYCSAVCCAYALRTAQKIKYQADDADISIFYMDVQSFGKGFESFHRACKDRMRFVRSRPYRISQGTNDSVVLTYTPPAGTDQTQGGVCQEEFDLVVLSVGIRPALCTNDLADTLMLPVDEHGFLGLKDASGLPDMQREGFFVVGTAESPTDIAGSIARAEAASAAVISEVSK